MRTIGRILPGAIVLAAWLGGCSSPNDAKASPCTQVCNCVAQALGDSARPACQSQCTSLASSSSDPVSVCESQLDANGASQCKSNCAAFASSQGDSGVAVDSGVSQANASGDSGGGSSLEGGSD